MRITRLMIWAAAAVAAVGVTTAAVTLAGASDNPNEVLSQDEVSRQAGQLGTPGPDPTGSPTPGPSGSPSATAPAGDGVTNTLFSRAAQLVVRCEDGLARLEAWSPNPGYRVDDVVRGPAPEVYLWVESDTFDDVMVFARCEAGEAVMTEKVEQDDHGGDRDDGDRNDDHGGRGRG